MTFKVEREIGGTLLSIETGKLAKQAHGAVVVTYGDTVVLGTTVTGPAREGVDFFPLTVDYREKMSAAGKFPGGFFKREGRPSTKEILTMRMIDRPLRPLFPEAFKDEVQIQVMVLSADMQIDPDTLGVVAGAASAVVSPLPLIAPIAAVRVGRVDGHFVLNPTVEQRAVSDLDLVVAGHRETVNMIEVGAQELSEDVVAAAIEFGFNNGVVPICEMLDELKKHAGKPGTWEKPEANTALFDQVKKKAWDDLVKAKTVSAKQERSAAVKAVYESVIKHFCPDDVAEPEHAPKDIKALLEKVEEQVVRTRIFKEHIRPDGRKLDQVRPLTCEVGWLPRTHGSAIFSRGETQSLVTVTLGTAADEQMIDDMMGKYDKKFLLHYNFPPFSVGEVKRLGSPGRREIGHGALAERSLEPVLPSPDDFPYTIRIVSDILESNGSSSMATVCGGSLSLMDAGVPLKAAVAGISVGMVEEGPKCVMFTDILGEEDHFGDMDFKVAGTRAGITGVQLDIKSTGLKLKYLREALTMAHKARMHILDAMDHCISKPRPNISEYAPRLLRLTINPEKIGKLIGPGGKVIRAIQADTGAQIDIDDDGKVTIACLSADGARRAEDAVRRLTEDIQLGKIYDGKVISIKDFGAFVELAEGQDGLCHISELADTYVKSVADVVQMGDIIPVKVILIDDTGRIKLSRKQALREIGAGAGGGGAPHGD